MIRVPFAILALLVLAAPAHSQQFSPAYQFLEAVRRGDGAKVTDLLQEPGAALVNSIDRATGEGALHIVARRGDAVYLRFLIQRGANPDIQDIRGNSPMMAAVNAGFDEGVAILVSYRANVNLANRSGETPLIRAVQLQNNYLARALLDAGADPDRADLLAGMSARDYARADTRMPAPLARLLADAPRLPARRP